MLEPALCLPESPRTTLKSGAMKIAITGASGFIGRRLMKLLAGRGHRLHVLSRHAGTNLPVGVGLTVWDPLGPAPEAPLR
ncbi:MAG TPA: NAD-dependent epimerase/dehydratase family protein, partial [Bryobacteraceae bacterium]